MDPGGKNSTEERDAPDAKKHFLAALWRTQTWKKHQSGNTCFPKKTPTRAEAESEQLSQLKNGQDE